MKKHSYYLLVFAALGLMLSSCEKESKLQISTTSYDIYKDEIKAIIVTPTNDGCTFKSSNDLIATVSDEGIITGKCAGKATITVTNVEKNFNETVVVNVKTKITMYKEPYLGFGASKTTVKSKESRELVLDNSTTLGYKGENNNILALIYTFKNSQYSASACSIPWGKSTMLIDFISERYIPVSVDDEMAISVNPEKTVYAAISYDISLDYIMVLYMDYNAVKTKNGNVSSSQLSEIAKQQIDELKMQIDNSNK